MQNKVEIESQILCAALRQSIVTRDSQGAITSARELYQLFPDLLPQPRANAIEEPGDCYRRVGSSPQASNRMVLTSYLRAAKDYLRKNEVRDQKESYNRILDAGFILRKSRLRLSHDLVLARYWLVESEAIPADGSLETPVPEAIEMQMTQTQQLIPELPGLVALLKEAQIIGGPEVQALTAQMNLAPEVPVERLILNSGYVSQAEMHSLKLAETLLDQGQITMAQFQVAIYDERTSGIRMAESLQVRGWLSTEVKSPAREDKR